MMGLGIKKEIYSLENAQKFLLKAAGLRILSVDGAETSLRYFYPKPRKKKLKKSWKG